MKCTRPQCLSVLCALIAFATMFTSVASAEVQNAQLNLTLNAGISPDPQFPNTASDSDSQSAPVGNLAAEVSQTPGSV